MNLSLTLGRVMALSAMICFSLQAHCGNNPSPFILNAGQWDGDFRYKVGFNNMTVFAEQEGFTFLASETVEHHDHADHDHEHHIPDSILVHAFRLRFEGANPIVFKGEGRMSAYHNYFLGKDQNRWKGHVPLFEALKTNDIYDGVSLRVSSDQGNFKYDYIVAPGAGTDQIAFRYTGQNSMELIDGNLNLTTAVGDFLESVPVSYQTIEGERSIVECRYVEVSKGVFGFEFPNGYDEQYELVIDPILVAATLSGTSGGASNYGHGAAFDISGNIYTHAISFNSGYPTDEGSFQQVYGGGGTDAAISKLTPDGTDLIYATFIGGAGGEYPHSTIVNSNEEIYVYGITSSDDFPADNNAFQSDYGGGGDDIFITGLSADGSELVGSTYVGGEATDGRNQVGFGYDNYRGEINLNLNGEVYLSSSSSSDDFPTTTGAFQEDLMGGQDAVVLKLSADLSEMIWSTFIGSEVDDMAYGIRVKDDQTVYITGAVGGQNLGGNGDGFVTTVNAYQTEYAGGTNDGFVAQLSADGEELINSTFLGASGEDKAYFLDFDNADNVWVYMQSQSNWDNTADVWGTGSGNVLVHKLSEDLSELLVTSYLTDSGSGTGTPVAFMVDLCNTIYISAYGVGNEFVASDDAIFDQGGFYLGVYAPEMEDFVYGTYYTGNHVDGGTSRFDKQGIVYQGVCISGGFNTTSDAWATTQSAGWDIGVFKIDFEIETVNAVASAAGQLTGCAPHTVDFENFSEAVTYEWTFGNGDGTDEYSPSYTFTEEGEYLVSLVVVDSASCNISDTLFIPIEVFEEVEFAADFDYEIDCETGTIDITDASVGPGDMEYLWDMGDGTFLTDTNPSHTYEQTGEYTVTLLLSSDACNQEIVLEEFVVYSPFVSADFSVDVIDFCDEFLIAVDDDSNNAQEYLWDMGDGTTLTNPGSFEYNYDESGTYEIELIISSETGCIGADTLVVTIDVPEPPVLDPEMTLIQQGFCEDLSLIGVLDPNGPLGTISWVVNGSEEGNEATLEWEAGAPGVYDFVVTITDAVCNEVYVVEDSFEFFETLGYEIPPNTFLCYYEDELVLDATVPYPDAIYNWNNGQSSDPVLVVTDEGEYTVEVTFNGCVDEQTADVNIGPEVPLNFEAEICDGQSNFVTMETNQFLDTVFWDNGQDGYMVEIFETGYHAFTAVDILGCDQVDSLWAVPLDDDPNLLIPNVFTPNGDGRNDLWEISGDPLSLYELVVFNRWGREVFQTNKLYEPWQGDNAEGSGNEHHDDTFMYILKYRDQCDLNTQVKTGDVKLLR